MDSRNPDFDLIALESRLRGERLVAPASLVAAIDAADPAGPRRANDRDRARTPQLVFATVLALGLVGALASVGGVSYAAQGVTHAATAAQRIVAPRATRSGEIVKTISAGGDQYRPGFGFGDPNHNHDGPPGLSTGPGGQRAHVTRTNDGKAFLVSASIAADEQAALYFSVLDPKGEQLLLTQVGSAIGSKVTGPQTKTIHYVLLVPRTVPLQLRIPANLLEPGKQYTIRLIAVDAQGNKSRTEIPFSV